MLFASGMCNFGAICRVFFRRWCKISFKQLKHLSFTWLQRRSYEYLQDARYSILKCICVDTLKLVWRLAFGVWRLAFGLGLLNQHPPRIDENTLRLPGWDGKRSGCRTMKHPS
jgi:hypothetical protein